MNPTQFYKQFILITIGTIALLILLHTFAGFKEFQVLSWLSLGFFFLVSWTMYTLGSRLAVSSNKNAFTSMVMVFVFAKMLLSVLIIAVYAKTFEPQSKLFVLPFFLVYLIYTIFETYFLMIVGRTKIDQP
ncbi:MAG: hypothetical protein KDC44_22485 [Phaeodactylibacter sp.]|nr:hypothetical protein [Phaeodactylibacter sp.]